MAGLEGTTYVARGAVDSPKNLMKARKMLKGAFEAQIKQNGFGFIELLSACPTNWKLSPQEAARRIKTEMIPYYPLGIFKEKA
jgi:2-oxoglutarate ferredoxin oxidoreductase subunit beta